MRTISDGRCACVSTDDYVSYVMWNNEYVFERAPPYQQQSVDYATELKSSLPIRPWTTPQR